MDMRSNMLKAIRFETPDFIPVRFHINPACWNYYSHDFLQNLMEEHSLLFPGYERQDEVKVSYGLNQRKDKPYTDPWGCVWKTSGDGTTGVVTMHPLADWSVFDSYRPPQPDETDGTFPIDWSGLKEDVHRRRARGELISGSLPHGHTFLRLQDIRGYENLIYDMLDESLRLRKLIGMVEQFNLGVVDRWMQLGPDMMHYPEDLGMQNGPMISPAHFRKYIKPVYETLIEPARRRGVIVHMHSDGDIRSLVDDLLDGGVEVINLQDLVNGIDWIAHRLAGRMCVEIDIDRQSVTPQGTPDEIDALLREEVEKIGSRQGGLMMVYGLYPGVPEENVRAVMDAMERYAGYYS